MLPSFSLAFRAFKTSTAQVYRAFQTFFGLCLILYALYTLKTFYFEFFSNRYSPMIWGPVEVFAPFIFKIFFNFCNLFGVVWVKHTKSNANEHRF